MQVNGLKSSNPSFGTYLGIKMQEKIMLAKQRNIFSKVQLNNLLKIEDDGLDAVLEISDKYIINRGAKNNGILNIAQYLTLSNGEKKIYLVDLKNVIEPYSKGKNVFHMHRFIKLFNDDYDLSGKVQAGYKLLGIV